MSIATELAALDTQRDNLASNLVTKGVSASTSETLAQLVPKVLDIPTNGGGVGPSIVSELNMAILGYISGS